MDFIESLRSELLEERYTHESARKKLDSEILKIKEILDSNKEKYKNSSEHEKNRLFNFVYNNIRKIKKDLFSYLDSNGQDLLKQWIQKCQNIHSFSTIFIKQGQNQDKPEDVQSSESDENKESNGNESQKNVESFENRNINIEKINTKKALELNKQYRADRGDKSTENANKDFWLNVLDDYENEGRAYLQYTKNIKPAVKTWINFLDYIISGHITESVLYKLGMLNEDEDDLNMEENHGYMKFATTYKELIKYKKEQSGSEEIAILFKWLQGHPEYKVKAKNIKDDLVRDHPELFKTEESEGENTHEVSNDESKNNESGNDRKQSDELSRDDLFKWTKWLKSREGHKKIYQLAQGDDKDSEIAKELSQFIKKYKKIFSLNEEIGDYNEDVEKTFKFYKRIEARDDNVAKIVYNFISTDKQFKIKYLSYLGRLREKYGKLYKNIIGNEGPKNRNFDDQERATGKKGETLGVKSKRDDGKKSEMSIEDRLKNLENDDDGEGEYSNDDKDDENFSVSGFKRSLKRYVNNKSFERNINKVVLGAKNPNKLDYLTGGEFKNLVSYMNNPKEFIDKQKEKLEQDLKDAEKKPKDGDTSQEGGEETKGDITAKSPIGQY